MLLSLPNVIAAPSASLLLSTASLNMSYVKPSRGIEGVFPLSIDIKGGASASKTSLGCLEIPTNAKMLRAVLRRMPSLLKFSQGSAIDRGEVTARQRLVI